MECASPGVVNYVLLTAYLIVAPATLWFLTTRTISAIDRFCQRFSKQSEITDGANSDVPTLA